MVLPSSSATEEFLVLLTDDSEDMLFTSWGKGEVGVTLSTVRCTDDLPFAFREVCISLSGLREALLTFSILVDNGATVSIGGDVSVLLSALG